MPIYFPEQVEASDRLRLVAPEAAGEIAAADFAPTLILIYFPFDSLHSK